jgi:hypothetical protein
MMDEMTLRPLEIMAVHVAILKYLRSPDAHPQIRQVLEQVQARLDQAPTVPLPVLFPAPPARQKISLSALCRIHKIAMVDLAKRSGVETLEVWRMYCGKYVTRASAERVIAVLNHLTHSHYSAADFDLVSNPDEPRIHATIDASFPHHRAEEYTRES